jgi:hypothetical protein
MYRLIRPVLLWLSGAYVILLGAYTILQSTLSFSIVLVIPRPTPLLP